MPQGGIDPYENPREAALRELKEETGITNARIVASVRRRAALDHGADGLAARPAASGGQPSTPGGARPTPRQPRRPRRHLQLAEWLHYDFPTKVRAQFSGQWLRYRGQTQKWFLLEFNGEEAEIDLTRHGEPEFEDWTWAELERLPHEVSWASAAARE